MTGKVYEQYNNLILEYFINKKNEKFLLLINMIPKA